MVKGGGLRIHSRRSSGVQKEENFFPVE